MGKKDEYKSSEKLAVAGREKLRKRTCSQVMLFGGGFPVRRSEISIIPSPRAPSQPCPAQAGLSP